MYILGLNAYHGDSSACLLKDGIIIAAIEEERIKRIKHWAGFPGESIKFCLQEAGLHINDVDHVTISRDPSAKMHKKIYHTAKYKVSIKDLGKRIDYRKKISSIKGELANLFGMKESDITCQIQNIEHHRSHLASAFFASPFDKAALLSIDGSGDFTTTMTGIGNNNSIEILNSVDYPHSIGIFYTALTQFLGFNNYGDEYKVMGLAPYGKPLYVEKLHKVLQFTNNGFFKLNNLYFKHAKEGVNSTWSGGEPIVSPIFSDFLVEEFGPVRSKNDEITQYHKDIAASVQKITEEVILHIANSLYEQTGLENLCVAGGVAQNSVANGKIISNTKFKKIYIPSAGHDAGTSIGSALYFYNHISKKERLSPITNAYLGSSFSTEYIKKMLDEKGITYKVYENDSLYDVVTDSLIAGGVIGWFQGRAEFGPRALGNRSILVDPRRDDAKELLNVKIKRRESFRPFAPSILREYVSEYFELEDDVTFMEKVFPIKKSKHSIIPAVTHVDGTGRLQTVDKINNPKYYKLISNFNSKTGVPILLNTSFNENEPIVNTPLEALDCFLRTKMDMLIMENVVLERK
ncbi:carbamoyltransferase C-terminal domain-containing protein [Rufibacter sp. XAAS-G3-1]|uniref:carbamoyltransferase family protein n=1 Tax=Rufibacter sp. XAAS-G3-1 TaxID=2729134 RepID=UPI0015E669AF|nr:carbamoyltransferase C-terminal domain-containing protein [Rufibacter sp. XAAS-G3-1]